MSFTLFPPNPASPRTPPPAWQPGPTSAGQETGGTSPCPASPSTSLSNGVGEGRGEVGAAPPSSGRVWLEVERLLAQFEPEARPLLWGLLTGTLKSAEAEQKLLEAARRLAPPPLLFQHLAHPCFQEGAARQEDQAEVHRLLRVGLWLAVDALEARVLCSRGEVYQPLLAEQCARMGRAYRGLKRRAGASTALVILWGEIRLLRHRGSAAVERLLFG